MMKYCFRITEEQYRCIGSRLAADAPKQAIIAECGTGEVSWSENDKRKTWCISKIGTTIRNLQEWLENQDELDSNICIFIAAEDISTLPPCPNSKILWALLVNDILHVYHTENGLPVLMNSICIIGHDIRFFFNGVEQNAKDNQFYMRTAQAFGKGTVDYLSNLTIGIAGASGTGSIVAEQLVRLGVKRLVLVDDDVVEEVNLGRMLNSSKSDVQQATGKVLALQREYQIKELKTEIIPVSSVILTPTAVKLLSQCDILFGCLDSADGRSQLNRISTFYCIPYFDLGIGLTADGTGSVSEISGAIRYVIPGCSSLISRGALSQDQITADGMRRENPEEYRERLKEKYIKGAQESAPAVISINMMTASYGVLDMLARLHPYRSEDNNAFETITIDMISLRFWTAPPSPPDESLKKYLGLGDQEPLLDMPALGGVIR